MLDSIVNEFFDAGKECLDSYKPTLNQAAKEVNINIPASELIFRYMKKDIKAASNNIIDYKTHKLYLVKLSIGLIVNTCLFYRLNDFVDVNSMFLIPFTLFFSRGFYGAFCALYGIRKMQGQLKEYFGDKLIVKDLEHKNSLGRVTLAIKLPLHKLDKATLEHAINATVINIIQSNSNKCNVVIEFSKEKTYDYMNLEKGSMERLEAILLYLKDKPIFVGAMDTEIDKRFIFFSRLSSNKLVKSIEDIEHRLGIGKNTLNIEFEDGKVIFAIRSSEIKMYFLDAILEQTKKPKDMELPFILGINPKTGIPLVYDYCNIQHFCFTGMTGSGKSSAMHSIIQTLMHWNNNIFYYMIDLKGTELPFIYGNFSNCKVASLEDGDTIEESIEVIVNMFENIWNEYRRRIRLFKETSCKDIDGYNSKSKTKLNYCIIYVDEANAFKEIIYRYTDKTVKSRLESIIATIFARGRSTGMYTIHAVQQIVESVYSPAWRKNTMTRGCAKVPELAQAEKILEGTPSEVQEKACKQLTGEYVIYTKNGSIYELQNIRVNDQLTDKTYINLLQKYSKKDSAVIPQEKSAGNVETNVEADSAVIPQKLNTLVLEEKPQFLVDFSNMKPRQIVPFYVKYVNEYMNQYGKKPTDKEATQHMNISSEDKTRRIRLIANIN